MIIGLLIVLAVIFIVPFTVSKVEKHLEYFLFIMGLIAVLVSKSLSIHLVEEIFQNKLLYFITAAVLVAGFIFKFISHKIKTAVDIVSRKIPAYLFVFILTVVLGLISSLITAIIAALILVEIVLALPYDRNTKVKLNIIVCFSIGLGAALTPIGEPLATIVISALNKDFMYLIRTIGIYVVPAIFALGIFGGYYINRSIKKHALTSSYEQNLHAESNEIDGIKTVIIRAVNIFIFIIALELLGAGFKPLVETYVISLPSELLYWINISSAVLDNATLAAAEISPSMTTSQVQAILMGLMISGGMLIPGNIPNIISADKLGIKSREWAKTGLPLGFALLVIFFVVLFVPKLIF